MKKILQDEQAKSPDSFLIQITKVYVMDITLISPYTDDGLYPTHRIVDSSYQRLLLKAAMIVNESNCAIHEAKLRKGKTTIFDGHQVLLSVSDFKAAEFLQEKNLISEIYSVM